MDVSINMEKTGAHIKRSIRESGYSIRDIMEITGVTSEQAIYKWYSGKSLPALETQQVLCKLLDQSITELLVIDGEFAFYSTRPSVSIVLARMDTYTFVKSYGL